MTKSVECHVCIAPLHRTAEAHFQCDGGNVKGLNPPAIQAPVSLPLGIQWHLEGGRALPSGDLLPDGLVHSPKCVQGFSSCAISCCVFVIPRLPAGRAT